jgi:3'-phosphoadenosine 5'-phosphosulfate sulfotransferase (PAPS reductase)/FAD synthetase
MTIHVASFSGGKDSTAVLLWLKEQGIEHRTIFCDTGWEHELTYQYIRDIDARLGLELEWLRAEAYPNGFVDLVMDKQMVPTTGVRFCTQELKIYPMHRWIEALPDGDVVLYQGIRGDESPARALMPSRTRVDDAGGYEIVRPIFDWTVEQVFELHRKHGIQPSPLYLSGLSRVGCMPCIMANKRELRQIAERFPEVRQKIEQLEDRLNEGRDGHNRRSFFRGDYIPARFQRTYTVTTKDGRTVPVPSVKEVFDYVTKEDMKQLSLLDDPPAKCLSVYNLCE